MLTNDEMDKYAEYLNDVYENKINFNHKYYNKIINEFKNIKSNCKPNSEMSLYIDYLFDAIKNPKFNNKIRKFKLQKIMNCNASSN